MNWLKKLFLHEKAHHEQSKDTEQTLENSSDHTPSLRVSYTTDKGNVRKTNEDSFFIDGKCRHTFGKSETDCYIELTKETHVYGLFDGMGGEAYGETASALSAIQLEQITPQLKEAAPEELTELMNDFCRAANSAIIDMLNDRYESGGGSTFAALCFKDGKAYAYNLGDSRIYMFRDGKLTQITEDHTLAMFKIKTGLCTEEELIGSRDHHCLTRFLGADIHDKGLTASEYKPISLDEDVTFMMCSDGVSDMIDDEMIAEILSRESENPAVELVDQALRSGGYDNATCVVLEYKKNIV